jgi:hypothetical protein
MECHHSGDSGRRRGAQDGRRQCREQVVKVDYVRFVLAHGAPKMIDALGRPHRLLSRLCQSEARGSRHFGIPEKDVVAPPPQQLDLVIDDAILTGDRTGLVARVADQNAH